jgi:hypothetical protein
MWTDAICIDQSNLQERSQQVGLMRRIFSEAVKTIAWVGDEREDSSLTLDRDEDGSFRRYDYLYAKFAVDGAQILDPTPSQGDFQAMVKLTDRAWFGRVWIVQEVAASNHLYIRCGNRETSWENFVEAAYFSEKNIVCSFDNRNAISTQSSFLFAISETYWSEYKLDLGSLLLAARSQEATDQRDRIFALLGLMNANDRNDFVPDYSLD